ncbi:MAG: type II toxin-antitoxin system RelE/ParE family toxin [Planctomycetota bacterium]|nr:type II toxin-antitoxin system RelE/ParE family toxin [Planctomycetota bacterium]MDA1212295.1 type II toxin-antitoxin system RelE/ParE family toxin [Planctomycetota bacterium]
MTPPVRFLPAARVDFDESFDWYARRSPEAAERFSSAVDAAIARILIDPAGFAFVDEWHQECLLKRFPFRMVYRSMLDQIQIVAVAHAKRKPGFWQER